MENANELCAKLIKLIKAKGRENAEKYSADWSTYMDGINDAIDIVSNVPEVTKGHWEIIAGKLEKGGFGVIRCSECQKNITVPMLNARNFGEFCKWCGIPMEAYNEMH